MHDDRKIFLFGVVCILIFVFGAAAYGYFDGRWTIFD